MKLINFIDYFPSRFTTRVLFLKSSLIHSEVLHSVTTTLSTSSPKLCSGLKCAVLSLNILQNKNFGIIIFLKLDHTNVYNIKEMLQSDSTTLIVQLVSFFVQICERGAFSCERYPIPCHLL